MKINIGEKIKSIRISSGETMETFGKRFNTSKATVNNWEKGRNLPNKENLKIIADVGNISVEELLHGSYDERIEFLLAQLRKKLNDDANVSDLLVNNIMNNVRANYYDNNNNPINDWYSIESYDKLEKDFNNKANRAIFMAKNEDSRDDAVFIEFKNKIDYALEEFKSYYMLASYEKEQGISSDKPFKLNYGTPKGMNEDFKNEIEDATLKFIENLNSIYNTFKNTK